jgi:uncharacterized protein (DUF1697 family)
VPLQVALLRAVNVAGHNMIAMCRLCDLLAKLGFRDATSLLQSGNLVFQSDRLTGQSLERLLEQETAKRLNLSIDYLVRSAAEWQKVVAANPFPREAKNDPARLAVMFLKSAPAAKSIAALQAAIQGPETVCGKGKELYVVYPDGIGRSKLTGSRIEKTLDTRGTARNWNTVLKLAARCG